MMKVVSSIALALFALGIVSSTVYGATATQSGNWSDSATWGGLPPSGDEEDVTIPMDITVTLDTSDEVGEIRVIGKLTAATGTYELTCDSLIVMGANSELEVGTTSARYSGDFTLTFKGESTESFMRMGHDMGWRALLAVNGGTLNLHGEDRVEWTRLDANVDAGSERAKRMVNDAIEYFQANGVAECVNEDYSQKVPNYVAGVTNLYAASRWLNSQR